GPVLAGVGLAHVGPAACYGGVAACYVAGLAISMRLGLLIGAAPGRKSASMAASLAAGCRAAWREPMLRAVLGVTVLMNVLVFPYQQMLVVFAREVLRAGPEWLGGLVAAEGLGSLVGALAIASRGGFIADRRLFAIAVLAAPFLLPVFSGSHWRWACAIILLG